MSILGKLSQGSERCDKNDKIWLDSATFGNILQDLARCGDIWGREFPALSGMGRPGVDASFLVFTCMTWSLRVVSSRVWSSMVSSGAVLSAIVSIGILDQTGPGQE